MGLIYAKFINKDANSLVDDGTGKLKVNVKSGGALEIEATNGLDVKDGGILNVHIAEGTIAEAKLDILDTPANGEVLSWNQTSGKMEWITPSSSDTKEVKVSANDTTPGYLGAKIVGTTNKITVTETNDGANETLVLNIGSNVFDKSTDTATAVPYTKSGWTGITTVAGALDDLKTNKADDSGVVHKTGSETIAGDKTFSNNVIIQGNLTITGSTVTTIGEEINIQDNVVVLNSDFTTGTPSANAGFEVKRGASTSASLIWDETADKWKAGLLGSEVAIAFEGHGHTLLEISDYTDSNYVKTSGDQTVNGIKTFGSIPVLPASDPTTDNQSARKAYVDGKVQTKKVETITLDATAITNKYVTLSQTPKDATAVECTPVGGGQQAYTTDFTVSGTQLNWSGKGMDGLVASGDKLIISYTY